MADTIYLDSFAMDKLICLCAHDFKHDFIEDSDRPKLALTGEGIGVGGSQTVNPYSSVTQTQQLPVLRIREKQNEEKYVVNPEDFPLACYIYLNIADMCKNDEAKTLDMFNKFCDNLGKINGRIGLQKKRDAVADAAEDRQKKRRKGGGKLSYKKKRGGKITIKSSKAGVSSKPRPFPRQRRLSTRKSAARATISIGEQVRADQGDLKIDGEKLRKKLIEWDKMLDIYKEWLSSPGRNEFYQDLNNLLNRPNFTPTMDKRTFLIYSSEWEDYEHTHRLEYNKWIVSLASGGKGGVKNAFNQIIKKCYRDGNPAGGANNYPRMISLKISPEKWENIKQFSLYLLNEWQELVIADPDDDSIYNKNQIINLGFKDVGMWRKSENYYDDQAAQRRTLPQPQPTLIKGSEKCIDDERTRDNCSPFKRREGQIFNLTSDKKIINNSAILSKYINNPENYYTCPIPSIIDPQSVCNNIPPSDKHLVTDENPIGIPADYSVNVVDQALRRTISVQIINDPRQSTRFRTSISFNGAGGQSINESRINNFALGGGPLSAYNVTLLFIRGFLKPEGGDLTGFGDWVNTDNTDRETALPTPYSDERNAADKATLRDIAGIFALKLMGDFSQELYAISKNSTIGPLLFLANDKVSVARYLLLKTHGTRDPPQAGAPTILNEPGGGGFLGYSRSSGNNYFLLMGPVPPGGGGKKKVKKTKTKRKSRKKVKKTKTKTKRKSRKKTKRKKKT